MILDPAKLKPIDQAAIVERRYHFGRLVFSPAGFHAQSIGTMTLLPDGNIRGYTHHAEHMWGPHQAGFVFKSEPNKHGFWFPTSYWTHEFEGMLIGYYNYHLTVSHNLCLIPDLRMSPIPRIIYVIASCWGFYQKTLPILIPQLLAEGVRPEQIRVVVNGAPADKEKVQEGVTLHFTRHNGYETSAHWKAAAWDDYDYAMVMHDTSEVKPGFRIRCEDINGHFQWDWLPLDYRGHCLMGMFRREFLQEIRPMMEKMDGCSKHQAVLMEVGGILFSHAHRIFSTCAVIPGPKCEDHYEKGATLRESKFFQSFGIKKYFHYHPDYSEQEARRL